MIHIGIDPGTSGALAWIEATTSGAEALKNMTERDVFQWLWDFGIEEKISATIEQVHAMPLQGVTSMFNFGMSYGGLRMALVGNRIPFETVTPAGWQRTFSLPTLKQCNGSITAKKNAHKARAQELFPHLKITHAIADALLICEYGRRQNRQGNL